MSTKKTGKKINNQSAFFTRTAANKGVKVPLHTPDNKPTEHWLLVRGVNSDQFRNAKISQAREMARISVIKDKGERENELAKAHCGIVASLIADWSFDEECNEENVVAFLLEAPQLCDKVDIVAGSHGDFSKGDGGSS